MSGRGCQWRGERHPTTPHLIEQCARREGHDGGHCPVLHKPGGRDVCLNCAPTPPETDESNTEGAMST